LDFARFRERGNGRNVVRTARLRQSGAGILALLLGKIWARNRPRRFIASDARA
jgi:hypothetical protein